MKVFYLLEHFKVDSLGWHLCNFDYFSSDVSFIRLILEDFPDSFKEIVVGLFPNGVIPGDDCDVVAFKLDFIDHYYVFHRYVDVDPEF